MPELMGLDNEETDITDQGTRDRDTQKKQANKDYVDKKFKARERDVREGDWVPLEQKRQNRLSSSYEKEPCESELGSASATAAPASATQAMAPKPGTPITTTAPAEIPKMSLPTAAVEIPPKVPVSGAEQPRPLRKFGK
ncbi:unnamed protein product, partial [Porites evermanni]